MRDIRTHNPKTGGSVQGSGQFSVDEERLKRVLDGDIKELNSYAKNRAQSYLDARKEQEKLSTSQIRNILDEIQRMPEREFDENRLHLLRPKLAYAAGRHRGRVKDFQELLDRAIQLTNKENYKYFRNFVEAIVAYHRYFGGK
jgi:CRISPR-associated protein Csm2